MTTIVIDFYAAHPRETLRCLRDECGATGVARYLVSDPDTDPRAIPRTEVDDAHALGMSVHFFFEMDPRSPAYFTHAQGVTDCEAAIRHLDQLAAPRGTVVYFAVDAPPSQIPPDAIVPYFNGVDEAAQASAERIVAGIYGFEAHVELARAAFPNIGKHLAQTYGTPRGALDLWQHEQRRGLCGGVDVDVDDCTVPGWAPEEGATGMAITKTQYIEKDAATGQSLEDLVKATVRVIYANEIAPGLEDEILQRVAAGEQDAVAKAIRAVGERLTQ